MGLSWEGTNLSRKNSWVGGCGEGITIPLSEFSLCVTFFNSLDSPETFSLFLLASGTFSSSPVSESGL